MGVRFRVAAARADSPRRRAQTSPARSPDAERSPSARARAARLTATAIALTLGLTTYGLVTERSTIAFAGLVSNVLITTLRARDVVRNAERSSHLLTRALADAERARGELELANERLLRTNANLRTLQIAVAQGFNLIDERTQGRLRQIVQEAGDDLAALVNETLVEED